MKRLIGFVAAVFLFAAVPATARAQTTLGFNESGAPACCAWGPYTVGWSYTPVADFFLTGITTRFGLADGFTYSERNVTIEVRDAPNGSVLRSVAFASGPTRPDPTVWVGGSFGGLWLDAGTSYFLAFLNVGSTGGGYLGINAVSGSVPPGFGEIQYGSATDGTVTGTASGYAPILRLTGATTVAPEPASILLLATGLLGLAGIQLGRRKRLTA